MSSQANASNRSSRKKKGGSDLLQFQYEAPPRNNTGSRQRYHKPTRSRNSRLVSYTPPPSFPLFCSSLFRFGMKSPVKTGTMPSWDDVWVAHHLVPTSSTTTCPICLQSELVSPYTTKCGHVFCLPCLLRFYHYSVQENSSKAPTCPCCNVSIYDGDWKLTDMQSVATPKVGSAIEMTKVTQRKGKFDRFPVCAAAQVSKLIDSNQVQLEEYKASLNTPSDATELVFVDMALQVIKNQRESTKGGVIQKSTTTQEEKEFVYYQASDGQLCFLSSFNMKCLQTEYENDGEDCRLPSKIRCNVLEIKEVQLSSNNKRAFLGHLPDYMDVVFVELDLKLSKQTRQKFGDALQKRKQLRQATRQKEKNQSRKSKQIEREAIRQRKARLSERYIDPQDEFFHSPPAEVSNLDGDDFGPVLSTSPSQQQPAEHSSWTEPLALRLGQVSTTDHWPELSSSPPTPNAPSNKPSWGTPRKSLAPADPSDATKASDLPPVVSQKKKKKGREKIVLLSTGGGRCNY